MNKTQFWKSIKLAKELEVSGRFIFNGLRSLHEMDTLYVEEEIFEVLYNLSVGLERLLKVAVILIEHDAERDQEDLEQSLITHSHPELLRRVRKKHALRLAGPHNELLAMLAVFYKTHRYGRYGLAAISAEGEEKTAFHKYLEKHLDISIQDEPPVNVTANSRRIKKFVGKTVGKIASQVYDVIREEASHSGVFTYEVRYGSKAGKIFVRNEYDFENEEVLWRELLVFLANSQETSGQIDFLRSRTPLEFDPELATDYLQGLACDEKKLDLLDELETLYADVDKPGERLKEISVIGDPGIFFDVDEED